MTYDDRPEAAKRLEEARVAKGYSTAKEAAEAYGWPYDTYAQHENGTRGLSRAAGKYANAFNVSEGWLLTGEGRGPKGEAFSNNTQSINLYKQNAKILGPVDFDKAHTIPIYGQAVAGVNGEFELNGNVLYDVLCPPQLQQSKGAYGVVVAGDSMSPRYFDGEIVYIDPNRRVKKGDFVVAQVMVDEFSAPHAFVKRFCHHNAEELVLEQFNPAKILSFPHERVVSVHYIAMSGDAIG